MNPNIYNQLLKSQDLPHGGVIDEGGTSVNRKTGDWSVLKPVKSDSCINCLQCWAYCPDSAIIVKDGKIVGFDYDHCKGCGVCASVCPEKIQAVKLVKECEINNEEGRVC